MISQQIKHIEFLDKEIGEINERIREMILPFEEEKERLMSIPGIGERSAENIISEIGVDMKYFPTEEQLSSWAGVCPGNKEKTSYKELGRDYFDKLKEEKLKRHYIKRLESLGVEVHIKELSYV